MATFFRTSDVWIVNFLYEGSRRQWYETLPTGVHAEAPMRDKLQSLYEGRAHLVSVRLADEDEQLRYIRGDLPGQASCPTGRRPRDRRDPEP